MPSSIVYTIKGGDAVVFPKSSIKHSRQDAYLGMAPTRQCTDVFFLVAIVAMWSAMSIVGALAIRTGNPFRLVAPMNDQGQLCGPYASSGTMRSRYFSTTFAYYHAFSVPLCFRPQSIQ